MNEIPVVLFAALLVLLALFPARVETGLPRIIWQTCPAKTLDVPKVRSDIDSWSRNHPAWAHYVHDDANIRALVARHMSPAYLAAFDAYPIGVMRADVWRYLVLYVYGGVYADVDAVCMRPVERWFERFWKMPWRAAAERRSSWPDLGYGRQTWATTAIVIGLEDYKHDSFFCQWTIASRPGHPVLRTVLDLVERRALRGPVDTSNKHFVHHYTGPAVWTEAIATVLGLDDPASSSSASIYRAAWADARVRQRAEDLGMALVHASFFQGVNVFHINGSVFAKDAGYVSWTEERDEVFMKRR